jgi:hypothetical protein
MKESRIHIVYFVGGGHQEAEGQHRGVEGQGQRLAGAARRHQGQVPRSRKGAQGT